MRRKIAQARLLRRQLTSCERIVWRWLRDRRFLDAKFRRQHPFGPFILDFYSASLKLAIELDGRSHADDDQMLYDRRRDRYLMRHGIVVVRVTNDQVIHHPTAAADQIEDAVRERARASQSLLPACGEKVPRSGG